MASGSLTEWFLVLHFAAKRLMRTIYPFARIDVHHTLESCGHLPKSLFVMTAVFPILGAILLCPVGETFFGKLEVCFFFLVLPLKMN